MIKTLIKLNSLLSIPILVLLSACNPFTNNSPLPEEMPNDFDFSLTYGVTMANELNTYENTYTKDLVQDGTATTEMVLSEDERLSIYEKFRNVDLFALPTETSNSSTVPFEEYDLKMTADGEEYALKWSTEQETPKIKEWNEVMGKIHEEIIFVREDYQELPEANGGYD